MKNLHVIPTDKPSQLHLWTDENGSRLELCELEYSHTRNTQHIYITSDEKLKQGDYGLSKLNEIINFHNGYDYRYYKKIIITTDQDLIADSVQAIDDEFLEWFVKNPSCEEVEVEDTCLEVRVCDCAMNENCLKPGYTIIIPRKEPCSFCEGTGQIVSSTTISGFKTCDCINIPQEEPKQELNLTCFDCNKSLQDCTCIEDTINMKQETLEEVKDLSYYKANAEEDYLAVPISVLRYISELEERMYSEEEVRKLFKQYKEDFSIYRNQQILNVEFEEWFEQFKKK
jgi:hypothetical protein